MASSGMLHHVALVRTDVSKELSASFIRVTRIGELGTTNELCGLLVHKRTIVTERPPLVGEISCQLLWIEGCHVVRAVDRPQLLISVF
jgi:hypothetical protein